MKTPETITRCEFCGRYIKLYPASAKQYENAQINIEEGKILLPEEIAGEGNRHVKSIAGYYCTPMCLCRMIEKILTK